MSYVDHVLQPGEEIRYRAYIHWIEYWPGALVFLLAVLLYLIAELAFRGSRVWFDIWFYAAGVCLLVAIILLAREWFVRWTTEIAVTNRRVIYKTGLVSRKTYEMHMDKVESVEVNQSILGRLLDFGDVNVSGTGTGFEPLERVDSPLELRNHITGI